MCVLWLNHMLYFKVFQGKSLINTCLTCVHLMLLFLCCAFCDDFSTMPLGFEVNNGFDRDKSWVSENGVFAFGFLEMGNDEYVVGIRYNLGDKAANLPVWTVGGGIRVSLNSTFSLSMDGNLFLMNPSRIVQWSSNTSTLGVQKVSLLNNGNLVLLSSKDEVIWESFSSPTNTLLPNQSLHYPQTLRAPSTKSISSYYILAISRGGELKLVWERNVTYWKNGFSSRAIVKEVRFDSSGVLGLYDENNKVVWSITSRDYGDSSVSLRHLRIDRDGNLRIYSWDSVSRAWKAVWQAVEDQCNVFGFCGLYSVCGYNSSGPVCNCLYLDRLEREVGPGGSACRKMVDLGNCRMHTSILVMKQTVLYGLYPSRDDDMSLSQTDCQNYCSNDTSCIAATSRNDGSGLCMIKRTTFISGYNTPFTPAVTFLKVCSVPQAAAANRHGNLETVPSSGGLFGKKVNGKKLILAIALIILVTVTVILSVQVLVFWIHYRGRRFKVKTRVPFGKDEMNPHYSALIRLSFEEIKELTNNFTNQLGNSVFKGGLPNKTLVVAKVLKNVVVSEKEFRVTVSTLSGTHHRNLASVKGFCFDPMNKILVYEYVPNGSLDKWLSKSGQNEQIWRKRIDIALGVARGVAYLHTECQKCIIHGNLKLENILLDENLVPKVTDFGLQDLIITGPKSVSSSESPSERDIYMLGQIFMEIVTCKNEIVGENVEQILDQVDKTEVGDSLEGLERIIRISFWCLQSKAFLRPSVGEVVKVLEGTLSVDRPPSCLRVRHDSMIDTEIVSEIEEEG